MAVMAGSALAGDAGAVTAGLGAVAGNIYNPWYRFQGGKGLGIAAGVVLTIWPWGLAILLATIGVGAILTRSSGKATLIALATAVAAAFAWWLAGWGNAWGLPAAYLPAAATVMAVIISPKHMVDAREHAKRISV
jgi:glycerol-3-phosphate acyltransferase PlsY